MSRSVFSRLGRSSRLFLALPLSLLLPGSSFGTVSSPADIQTWAGSGSNSAILVIDWKDGTSDPTLAWGYHWNGTATGANMLDAVIAVDPSLYAYFGGSANNVVLGLGYDTDHAGSLSLTPALTFTNQIASTVGYGAVNSRSAVDPADNYHEGWTSGYWSYYGKASDASAWTFNSAGFTTRVLTNDAWDGWTIGGDGTPSAAQAAVVPEPSMIAVVGVGLMISLRRRTTSR